MIKYSLVCEQDHAFEAWFGSGEEFETQNKRGFVECPLCGTKKVSKALMTPGVAGTRKSDKIDMPVVNQMAEKTEAFMSTIRKLRKHLETNAENVGDRFVEEARKIHYGETEAREIYGKASIKEAASLAEEGVGVIPLPVMPEDKN